MVDDLKMYLISHLYIGRPPLGQTSMCGFLTWINQPVRSSGGDPYLNIAGFLADRENGGEDLGFFQTTSGVEVVVLFVKR